MKKREAEMTAAELMSVLQSDPCYLARKKMRDELIEKRRAQLALDQRELKEQLIELGIKVRSVDDLVNSNGDYSKAIPLLVQHLAKPHEPEVLESIARALIIPQVMSSPSVLTALVCAFREAPNKTSLEKSAKWAVAYAISQLASADFEEVIRELMRDGIHGSARSAFLSSRAIAKSKREDTCDLLVALLQDSEFEVVSAAIDAIVKRHCSQATLALNQLTAHANLEVARRARRALKKLSGRT